MLDWFSLNSSYSSNLANLVQNRKNTTVLHMNLSLKPVALMVGIICLCLGSGMFLKNFFFTIESCNVFKSIS